MFYSRLVDFKFPLRGMGNPLLDSRESNIGKGIQMIMPKEFSPTEF